MFKSPLIQQIEIKNFIWTEVYRVVEEHEVLPTWITLSGSLHIIDD